MCESGGADETESESRLRTSCPRPVLKPDGHVVRRPGFTGPGRRFIAHPQGSSRSLFAMRKAPYGYGARLQWEGADVPSADDHWGRCLA